MTDKIGKQLLEAAANFERFEPGEVKALLRRAAIRISNARSPRNKATLLPEVAEVISDYAEHQGLTIDEAVNAALLDWASGHGMIEIQDLGDEEE
ncbi:hypothetical protein NA8A_24104 [Nitratireductor indicus C115]|uniref:Uncharacterized protein n=1 Tax=Nitratireductor indicus C115 TaxID=1231190 RepID=K2NK28_9HYPH|nr:hypothetical protein [Nitratireductor indicus]EKF39795.1 hypothetical protein NA8A_24104 [Nitratireductor indicus C115]SFQ80063.1 hypothetical protein SAMN05216176_11761 [Nitratireductor indicus]